MMLKVLSLVLALASWAAAAYEMGNAFLKPNACDSYKDLSTVKLQIEFMYPKEASPAIMRTVQNIKTGGHKKRVGTLTVMKSLYDEEGKCLQAHTRTNPPIVVETKPVVEGPEDWNYEGSNGSIMQLLHQLKAHRSFKYEDPKTLQVFVIVASTLPFYKFAYDTPYSNVAEQGGSTCQVQSIPQIRHHMKQHDTHRLYLTITTKHRLNQWAEFYRLVGLTNALAVSAEQFGEDPVGSLIPLMENFQCEGKLTYPQFLFSRPEVHNPLNIWQFQGKTNPTSLVVPLMVLVGSHQMNNAEYDWARALLYDGLLAELHQKLLAWNSNTRISVVMAWRERSNGYTFTTVDSETNMGGIGAQVTYLHPLIRESRAPRPTMVEEYAGFIGNTVHNVQRRMPGHIIKPFFYIMYFGNPPSIENNSTYGTSLSIDYDRSFKKMVTSYNGEVTVMHPWPLDKFHEEPRLPNDMIVRSRRISLKWSFAMSIAAMQAMPKFVLEEDIWQQNNVVDIPNTHGWSPVDHPGVPGTPKDVDLLIMERNGYSGVYASVRAAIVGRNAFLLAQILAKQYNVHIRRVSRHVFTKQENYGGLRSKCAFTPVDFTDSRYKVERNNKTIDGQIGNFVASVYTCIKAYDWKYKHKVVLILEPEFNFEVKDLQTDAIAREQPLGTRKIHVVYAPRAGYKKELFKHTNTTVIDIHKCYHPVTCIAALVAHHVDNYVPFPQL